MHTDTQERDGHEKTENMGVRSHRSLGATGNRRGREGPPGASRMSAAQPCRPLASRTAGLISAPLSHLVGGVLLSQPLELVIVPQRIEALRSSSKRALVLTQMAALKLANLITGLGTKPLLRHIKPGRG